ncbi:hypothetical protein L1987_37843 [Smallanthus sonchifolius]|uniref:Uncharacterized protein n=1 Tax=Smallanthus sonchifolius TaxID=185202 RepID=A0ACB9HH99_9ASTR|nr:hypothetical protein L1987_37843 [Smallanthus sonchifolius]
MSIALADRSIKYPRQIVENLLVKVGKFVFPVDFVILDMEVDDRVPLILRSPFLCTAKAVIDVFDGKLTLRVGDELLESLLEEPDDYGDEMQDELLGMMVELDAIIGKPSSVGMTEKSVEDPDDPGKGLEPLPITVVHSKGREGDSLLGYLNNVIFRPGRFKLWWKDRGNRYNGYTVLVCLSLSWKTGRPRRMKAVPVRIKEKPPDRLV